MRNLAQTINHKDDIRQVMQDVLDMAKAKGATDAAVSVSCDEGYHVDVRMGAIETVAFSEDRGVSVVVYLDKQKGSATSSDTSPKALEDMINHAYDIAKVSAKDPCFGLPDKDLVQMSYPELELSHAWDMTPERAAELAITCEDKARSKDKRIKNADGTSVSSYAFTRGYANTHGFSGEVQSTRHSISCALMGEHEGGMQRDYAYTTARQHDNLMSIDEVANLAAERTVSRLNPKKLKTQKCPVIFSSRVSSSLLGSFIQAISGASVYQKNTFLLDSIGKHVFPSNISVYEVPHDLGALGSSPFDSEGIVTRNNVLVDGGMLQQYVLGSYSARRLGLATTANAGGVHNLTIKPTMGELSDIIKTMGTGLLVTELMGQGVNGITGDYSRGASGFWVEQGEIQYPVDGLTIAGNLKDMYLQILGVGSDINPSISTRCGSILIEEMTIAGV